MSQLLVMLEWREKLRLKIIPPSLKSGSWSVIVDGGGVMFVLRFYGPVMLSAVSLSNHTFTGQA